MLAVEESFVPGNAVALQLIGGSGNVPRQITKRGHHIGFKIASFSFRFSPFKSNGSSFFANQLLVESGGYYKATFKSFTSLHFDYKVKKISRKHHID